MAKIERLIPFSDLEIIDNMVVNSMGAYKHDEVFMMGLDFVNKMTLMHYEQKAYQGRFAMYEMELNTNKK